MANSIKDDFEKAFAEWKQQWFTGDLQFSNDTRDNRTLATYATLKKMGAAILPFIIEKLEDKDNFVALVLYDELQTNSALNTEYTEKDRGNREKMFEGEVERARRTVKLYRQSPST